MSEIKTLHDPFSRYLRESGIPFIRARSDRESTIHLGHPDFTLLVSGRSLLVEFKTKEGKLSADQKQRIAELQAAGTRVHVLRDLSVAIEVVTAWRSTIGEIMAIDVPKPKLRKIGRALYEEHAGELIKIRNLRNDE